MILDQINEVKKAASEGETGILKVNNDINTL